MSNPPKHKSEEELVIELDTALNTVFFDSDGKSRMLHGNNELIEALVPLIKQRELKARLDELTRLKFDHQTPRFTWHDITDRKRDIENKESKN